MKNNYIERYIYAVTRYLPAKMQGDVEKELDVLIEDMLDQRCGGAVPTDEDVRAVLTELGSPEALAAKYNDDEKKALIGGNYYIVYKYIMKIALPIVAAVVAFAGLVSSLFGEGIAQNAYETYEIFEKAIEKTVGGAVEGVVSGAIGGALFAFALITIIFAILERKNVLRGDGDFLSFLPSAVPEKAARIKPHEPIVEILFTVFFVILLIGFSYVIGWWFGDDTGWVPVFESSVLRGFWPFIMFCAALSIVNDVVKLVEGRYTKKLMVVTIVCNVLTVISAAVMFLNERIINPAFVSAFGELDPDFAQSPVLDSINLVILGLIVFAAIIGSITVIAKTHKYDR